MDNKEIITFEEGWDYIQKNLVDVVESKIDNRNRLSPPPSKPNLFKTIDNRQYMKIYEVIYGMCIQRSPYNFSQQLYAKYVETIQNYVEKKVLPTISSSSGGIPLLQELSFRWENHKIMTFWYSKVFIYVDRFYVKHHELPSLGSAALIPFKNCIYDRVKVASKDAIVSLINKQRDGENIDEHKDLISRIMQLFDVMDLDSYTNDWEIYLIYAAQDYYAKKRDEWIQTMTIPEYLIHAEKVLIQERKHVKDYLNPNSETKLIVVLEDVILGEVESKLQEYFHFEVGEILDGEGSKSEDFARMLKLFSSSTLYDNGLQPMADMVKVYIASKVESFIATLTGGKDKDDVIAEYMLECREKYLDVINRDFAGCPVFQNALEDALLPLQNQKED